jgi:hypothetical protein
LLINNHKYNYKLIKNIKNNNSKINIICKEHGVFTQKISNHISGRGCPLCANNIKSNESEFIFKSNIIHNNIFNYDKTIYLSCMKKVIITCPIHGDFKQRPNDHLNGCGCPFCKESKGEKNIVSFLEKNKIKYNRQKTFIDCKYKGLLNSISPPQCSFISKCCLPSNSIHILCSGK